MNVFVDETTGYLVIDDIADGIQILPEALYQSYLKQIADLKEKVIELQDKLISQHEMTDEEFAKRMQHLVKDERSIGFALGLFIRSNPAKYEDAYYYYKLFDELYYELQESGKIREFEASIGLKRPSSWLIDQSKSDES